MSSKLLAVTFAWIAQAAVNLEGKTVVVTGATGRTGSLLYKRLKADGSWNVRALLRNQSKAKDILGCDKCDETEGIFVGDVTQPDSLKAVMTGAQVLAIATASVPICTGPPFLNKCKYPEGAKPKQIDWLGTKLQVEAFAAAGGDPKAKRILYVSTMDTTVPNNFLDKVDNGYVSFYHLQAEAFIMNSGIPFTIPKACGLGDGVGGKKKLLVGHDDASFSLALNHLIQRDDVAHVLAEAVRNPDVSSGLRFDLCSHPIGAPTTNIVRDVFQAAMYSWDPRRSSSSTSSSMIQV
jgi:uncharacterized protein YbjT (DUF2867 family)